MPCGSNVVSYILSTSMFYSLILKLPAPRTFSFVLLGSEKNFVQIAEQLDRQRAREICARQMCCAEIWIF